MRLQGKIALISGGASNLGRATANLFLSEGASVVVMDLFGSREDQPQGTKEILIVGDVRNEDDWNMAIAETTSRFGRLDILVNNAGLSSASELEKFDVNGFDNINDVNIRGAFLGTRAALPIMQEQQQGSFVHISSIGGIRPLPGGHVGYYASKAALLSLSKSVALRYGKDNIRSNAVLPGVMPPMSSRQATVLGNNRAHLISQTPLGREGQHDEIARAICFLASDEASFVTGAELLVDGGLSISI
jgi:NAD(P)-dependent dehydrogenase (short-subunit alcohol dehydrogenase family)